tara:strand:- start:424 stop:525 length:102 start_codon:yes stop_codon:yes gene_type:complete
MLIMKNKNLKALKSYWGKFNTKQYYKYLIAIQK